MIPLGMTISSSPELWKHPTMILSSLLPGANVTRLRLWQSSNVHPAMLLTLAGTLTVSIQLFLNHYYPIS